MGSISEKLEYLNETKEMIKNAIIDKGIDVPAGATFRDYAIQISAIEAESNLQEKSVTITSNTTTTISTDEGYDGMSKVNIVSGINNGASYCAKVYSKGTDADNCNGSGTFTLPANKKGYVLMFTTTQNSATNTCSAGSGTTLYSNGGNYGYNQTVVMNVTQYTISATTSARTITVTVSGTATRQSVVVAAY